MPIYEYICDDCNKKVELQQSMKKRIAPLCSVCQQPMRRLYSTGVDATSIERPRYSLAMGVLPKRIEEAKRLYPGSEYNAKGDLLIRSRQHKLFEMKRRGMVELE